MNEINTTEMKARFFAQYYGQPVIFLPEIDNCAFKLTEISILDSEVGIWGDWSGGTNPEVSCNDVMGIDAVSLTLRSIHQLNDEEKIALYHIHSQEISYDYTQDWGGVLKCANHWLSKDPEKSIYKYSQTADYLRSVGVLIPFMGLSTDEILKRGWAVIGEGETV